MDYVTLGRNIKKYRQFKGMRQTDLAKICGCSNSHIGQIENARGIPSLEMTVNIANALEVTTDQLISDSYINPEQVYIKELSEHLERYSDEQKRRVCEGLAYYLDFLDKILAENK